MLKLLALAAMLLVSWPSFALDIDKTLNDKVDRAYGGWDIEPGAWVETFGAAASLADALSGTAQPSDADLDSAAGGSAAGNSKFWGTNSGGTVGFYDQADISATITDGTAIGDLLMWDGDSWDPISSLTDISISGGTASTIAYWDASQLLGSWTSGGLDLPDAGGYKLNLSATNEKYSGTLITRTVDSGVGSTAIGQCYHVDTDGELIDADADGATTMPCLGLAVESGTGSKMVLLQGVITLTAWNWTIGGLVYVSTDPTTTTGLTQTAPSGTGDLVQIVGVALSADTILVTPNYTMVEID